MTDRKAYTREFKMQALELLRTSGKSGAVLEHELGLYHGQLSSWRRALEHDQAAAFPATGQQTTQDAQMAQLRREIEILRQERDILIKRWPSSPDYQTSAEVRPHGPAP